MVDLSSAVIGFIGSGVMGQSMARNLLRNGHKLRVYSRTKVKAEPLLAEGAVWCDTVAAAVGTADVVITMLGFPADVEEVYLGDGGIVLHAREHSYVVDMTTSSPALAVRIYQEAKRVGLRALDAPVSGGDIGAQKGTLSIMVGGDADAFGDVLPIFRAMGSNVVYQGAAGAGQHTKMCNQIAIASNMMGVCEALVYARRAGLDAENVLGSIATGAAGSWSLTNLAPRILQGDFSPGFFVKHFIKDMAIALEAAQAMGLSLPGLALAKSLYDELAAMGEAESGTHALYKLLARV